MEGVTFTMTEKRKRVNRRKDKVELQRNRSNIEGRTKENRAFAFNIGSYGKNIATQCVIYDKKIEQGG